MKIMSSKINKITKKTMKKVATGVTNLPWVVVCRWREGAWAFLPFTSRTVRPHGQAGHVLPLKGKAGQRGTARRGSATGQGKAKRVKALGSIRLGVPTTLGTTARNLPA